MKHDVNQSEFLSCLGLLTQEYHYCDRQTLRFFHGTPYLGTMTIQTIILDQRVVVQVTGTEVISFLDRVLTCRLSGLTAGQGRFGALLTPQGKILSDLFASKCDDELYLDLPRKMAGDLIKRLTMLKLRADVTFTSREDLCVIQSNKALADCVTGFPDTRYSGEIIRSIAEKPETGLTASQTGASIYQSQRIAAGLPECGTDYMANEVFPADVNMDLLNGVDFKKGCFVGQEVASRMKRKTEVRKRTLVVSGATDEHLSGATVTAGESTLGEVTSWFGSSGLALIRVDRLNAALEKGDAPVIDTKPVDVLLVQPSQAIS